MKSLIFILFLILSAKVVESQTAPVDTLLSLEDVTILAKKKEMSDVQRMKSISGTMIISGRKNEVIQLSSLTTAMPEKIGRQIFAKIPGTFVYDMDGSGNQINISTRGLDPHRSWEYNVRQNNVLINSDLYGYPASHYSPPLESMERIELVRGTSSLQYGAQFGGMINYITKLPDTTKPISYEGIQTIGSFGLLSSYNAISGKAGKLSYSAYYYRRSQEGYRDNSQSDAEAQFISFLYDFTPRFSLKAELGRSTYLYQIPGPLTDVMFLENPRQATRSRNYFSPDIYVPSITAFWQIDPSAKLTWSTSAVLGTRSSVQFIGFADVADEIDPATNQYRNRQVDIDYFNSYTSEIRLLKTYNLFGVKSSLSTGVQYTDNILKRNQLGVGTTGTTFDLSLVGDYQRKVELHTRNIAVFAENMFQINTQFSITPGIRFENGKTNMSGVISYLDNEDVPKELIHSFPLLGVTTEYKLKSGRIYGGISQAFRPVLFSDILPASPLNRTAEDLKDANGFTAEVGLSGHLKNRLYYDISYFCIKYNDRLGNLAVEDGGETYILKTNLGNTLTHGLETFVEFFQYFSPKSVLSVFTSTALFNGEYISGTTVMGNENISIAGNTLESVPAIISRNGIKYYSRNWNVSLQYSYVGETFSDAINRIQPNANGTSGIVPAYGLFDFLFGIKINKNLSFNLAMNNLLDKQYFTKRPSGYPGAGVWNSDGRSFTGSVKIQI